MLMEMSMHVECVPKQVRFVSPSFLQALKLCTLKVILQDVLVVRVRALLDDNSRTLSWRETTDVGKALHKSH
jgi:hypothetical protein